MGYGGIRVLALLSREDSRQNDGGSQAFDGYWGGAADRLEKATLIKAFRGDLVPQDPNDEPASVLLERIRAEQQEDPLKGKS